MSSKFDLFYVYFFTTRVGFATKLIPPLKTNKTVDVQDLIVITMGKKR